MGSLLSLFLLNSRWCRGTTQCLRNSNSDLRLPWCLLLRGNKPRLSGTVCLLGWQLHLVVARRTTRSTLLSSMELSDISLRTKITSLTITTNSSRSLSQLFQTLIRDKLKLRRLQKLRQKLRQFPELKLKLRLRLNLKQKLKLEQMLRQRWRLKLRQLKLKHKLKQMHVSRPKKQKRSELIRKE